jgi:hypothetical protein
MVPYAWPRAGRQEQGKLGRAAWATLLSALPSANIYQTEPDTTYGEHGGSQPTASCQWTPQWH